MTTPSTPELLSEMARLTALSGRISDVQIKNLQMFPLVFFEAVQELKIDYDLSHKSDVLEDTDGKLIINVPTRNNYVAYYLTLDETKNTEDLDKRYMALEKSVRALFWTDLAIEVYFNGKIMYKSVKV
jgi:hypothetical protein